MIVYVCVWCEDPVCVRDVLQSCLPARLPVLFRSDGGRGRFPSDWSALEQ